MGEDDGSSDAAQSALQTENRQRHGLLGRLLGGARIPDRVQADDHPHTDTPANGATQLLGMGNLRRLRVEDVAIPKVEIVAVPVEIELDELVQQFRDSGLTRLPVFDGTLDTPIGFVHLKDIALRHGFNGEAAELNLRQTVRPLLFVPPSMPIGVLLQKMQTDRRHMALVIDEYGGVDGLVTIEDLIEQVIGEIEDEHDVAEGAYWVQEKPGCYLAQARTPLDEFEAEAGLKLTEDEDEEEVDTLGGLVFMMAGRVPARGEVLPHDSGAQFEIVDADPRRIKRLRVRLPQLAEG